MIANRSIVLLYGPTFDAAAQVSKHHLARYFAKRNKVLYVEAGFHAGSFLTRREEAMRLWRRYRANGTQVAENLWVQAYPNILPFRAGPVLSNPIVNDLNQSLIYPQLARLLRRLRFEDPIFIVGTAYGLPLIRKFRPSTTVYHCSDDFSHVAGFPASFAAIERDLIKECDLVIATAEELRRAKAALHPRIVTVTNGADIEHCSKARSAELAPAADVAALPRPIIGFVGGIFEWVDLRMMAQAAVARPDWSFAMIGQVHTDVSLLAGLHNVHMMGPRPYAQLPSILKAFDVATVPFVIDDLTRRASPIKFYEYLASGVPVVATRLPDLEPFDHLAELVSSPEEFVPALERARARNTPDDQQQRIAEARHHSWEARCAAAESAIEEVMTISARASV